MKLKWNMIKGVVRCERCGFITRYGYQDRDTVCYNCHKGYFRFCVNEVSPINITTEGEEYEEYQAEEMEKQWIANYDFERGDVKY